MKKGIIIFTSLIFAYILIVIGLNEHLKIAKENSEDYQVFREGFIIYTTLDDGRKINSTFDVPYKKSKLDIALSNKQITIDEFINSLELIDTLKDGGSKLYKYNKKQKTFGKTNFYVLTCNSLDNIKDIFISQNKKLLSEKCSTHINDLKDVKMTINEGTLTRSGATITITDTSDKNNLYSNIYRLEIKENEEWKNLKPIIDSIYYSKTDFSVDSNNKLVFIIFWEDIYGKLENGEYRIIKDVINHNEEITHYITAEFIIE